MYYSQEAALVDEGLGLRGVGSGDEGQRLAHHRPPQRAAGDPGFGLRRRRLTLDPPPPHGGRDDDGRDEQRRRPRINAAAAHHGERIHDAYARRASYRGRRKIMSGKAGLRSERGVCETVKTATCLLKYYEL